MMTRLLLCCSLMLSLFALSACESVGYYGQAMRGHLGVLRQRQSIDTLLQDPALDPALQQRLQELKTLREFAGSELGLPVGHNYEDLVMQDQPYVVWNVFAAPELSLTPRQWCYPLVGCVSYRGYFDEDAARAYAATLREEGFDVYVGGVAAYSTLGWFSDPMLSSILQRESWQLAGLLFHELAHQVVYARDDSEFNESFATTVEQEGLRRWLDRPGLEGAARTGILLATAQERNRREGFVTLVQAAVKDLRQLYASEGSPEQLRAGKQARLERLRSDYAQLKQQWEGYSGYDGWFASELNNAQLSTVATYHGLVPAFEELLKRHRGNLPAFYAEVTTLANLDAATRQARLAALLPD